MLTAQSPLDRVGDSPLPNLTLQSILKNQAPACGCSQCLVQSTAERVDRATLPTKALPLSGDDITDALLAVRNNPELTRSWNVAPGGTITYSFPTGETGQQLSSVVANQVKDPSEVSEVIKNSVRQIFQNYAQVVPLNFQEVPDSADSTIRISFGTSTTSASFLAFAYFPASTYGGQMFLSPSANGDPNFFAKGPGSPGYGTMIHEIGHAMGLKHPYEYRNTTEDAEIEEIPDGIFLPPELDHRHNTVMSYNGRDFQGRQNAQTLMNYDIQALQYLYGVNRNFRSGNDVYQWDGNSFLAVEAIWDGGGVDTLEMVSLPETDSYLFDLNPGGLLTTQTGRQGRFFGEYPSNEPLYPMFDRGKSIAPGAILENIYSTSGSDEVIGNGVNNLILTRRGNDNARGGPGDDTVWGGRDNDLLNGDDGIDQLNGNIGADTVIGGNGNDQLNGGRDDDQLLGEAGDDLLSGDLGNDTLTGGAGADRFVLGSGAGQDSILDFATGIDRVQLNGVGREAIALVPQGGATLVQIAGSGEILAAVNGVIALSDFL